MNIPERRALDINYCAKLLHLPVMDVNPRSVGTRLQKSRMFQEKQAVWASFPSKHSQKPQLTLWRM